MRPFATPVAVAFVAAIAASSACSPMKGGEGARSLPPYAGDIVDLFDDVIDPHAVGLELEPRSDPRTDPKERARAQLADEVVRARVSTVTGQVEGGDRAYQVGFKRIEHLAGKNAANLGSDETFSVRIDKSSPAMGIVQSFEGRLVGKTLVVYAKAFSRVDIERDIHFHADPDQPDVIAAVKEAVILDEAK